MPKSKKKKNQDFQKVKLKVGRKLQKADNVTNASFKTRSVQVVQHIKTGTGSEPTTRRNLNIVDLLNQCQHYSTSVRLDAVNGLKELLSAFPEILEQRLSQVIDRISQLMVDKDPAIRSALIKLFKLIAPLVDIYKMRPFFPVVSAHVCCAMTHIYEDIQSDSLQILDIFLEHYPSLIVDRSSQIIPNFIEQISHQNNSKKSSAGNRSLSIKPDGKIQAHKWRSQVLSRLSKLLSTLVESSGPLAYESKLEGRDQALKVMWQEEEEVSCTPIPTQFKKTWTSPGYRVVTMKNVLTKEIEERGYNLREPSGVLRLLETILPVLLECWVEATSSQHSHMDGHLLSLEACSLRHSVVKTIQILWHYSEQVIQVGWQSSLAHFLPDFQQHFLKFFPYAPHSENSLKNKKTRPDTEQCTVHSLNITVCDIMSFFLSTNQKTEYNSSLCLTITQYLLNYLQEESYDSSYTSPILQVIERLMASKCQNNEGVQQLLSVLVSRFTWIHDLSKEKKLLLQFFSRVVTENEEMFIREDTKRAFLELLPALFRSCVRNPVMSGQIMEVLRNLACRTTNTNSTEVSVFVYSVLEMDMADLICLDNKILRRVIELFYHVPTLREGDYRKLADLVQNNRLPIESCKYLLQVMQHRYNKYPLTIEEQGLYVQFLFRSAFDAVECPLHHVAVDRNLFNQMVAITETVANQLLMFPNTEQIVELLCCFLRRTMEKNTEVAESIYLITSFLTIGIRMKTWIYPVSIPFTEDIFKLLWNFLLVITNNDKRSSINTLILEDITDRCRSFIFGGETVMQMFLREILQELKECDNREQVHSVQQAAILILEHSLPWPDLSQTIESQTVFDDLEKINGVAGQTGWKKLKTLFREINKDC